MIDFKQLKARPAKSMEALQKTLESGNNKKDERFWKPTKDAQNLSMNIIRFLPAPFIDYQKVEEGLFGEDKLTPIARIKHHAFQGPKSKWLFENSLQTFGEACPIRDADGPQWGDMKKLAQDSSEAKSWKTALMARLPKEKNIVGIYVIKDGTVPDNNGKVFLFDVYKGVLEIIDSVGNPKFGDAPIDVFSFWEGANLNLNIVYEKKTIGTKEVMSPNFKNAKFDNSTPLFGGDDEKIEEIWKSQYSILDFYDRKYFKTYEEIQAKYNEVMGLNVEGVPTGDGSSVGKATQALLQETEPVKEMVTMPAKDEQSLASTEASDPLAQFKALLNK
jgi:hypothetical protein